MSGRIVRKGSKPPSLIAFVDSLSTDYRQRAELLKGQKMVVDAGKEASGVSARLDRMLSEYAEALTSWRNANPSAK